MPYKTFVRPMLASSSLFHHTPIQRQTEPGEWVVLECASEDGSRAFAGVFRLGRATEEAYSLYPKGLDVSHRYRVTYDSCRQTREMEGGVLLDQGLRVRVPGPYTSELLLFQAL